MNGEIQKLETLESMYPNEWIAVEILEVDQENNPLAVKLLGHSKERERALESINDERHIGFFYTGKIFEDDEGYIL